MPKKEPDQTASTQIDFAVRFKFKTKMTLSIINRLTYLLTQAFTGLSAETDIVDIEHIAMLIHQSMDQGYRVYHTSSHLFDLCVGMNSRQTLAALFHDIVYYQLDHGFSPNVEALLRTVIRIEHESLTLQPIAERDMPVRICANLFNVKEGDILSVSDGMNEFLSAVVAIRALQAYLSTNDLLAIAAYIEATIPFRGIDANGKEFPEQLADRVRNTASHLRIACSNVEIAKIVTDAVVLANRDVISFSARDPGYFLSTTWLLIEESNIPLNPEGVYSIQEYRNALLRMEKFLCSLNPKNIFHQFQDTPGEFEIAGLHQAAQRNITFAITYIGAKIVGIALIEALAMITGGDCSISMFLGDIRSAQGKPPRAEDFLPLVPNRKENDPALMHVLEIGRSHAATNDLTASPMTAFMCKCLGQERILHVLQFAKQMFTGEMSPMDFLSRLEPEMVRSVAEACARIAHSRAEALLNLRISSEN